MKKLINGAFALLIGMLVLDSCYYDNPPEPAPIDPASVSFTTHLVPIFKKSCATANCHDGKQKPNLLENVAYQELMAGGYVNTIFPEQSSLYKTVEFIENPMPPGGPQISKTDRTVILLWIQKGAPND